MCAICGFGKLQRRLCSEHSVSLPIEVAVYQGQDAVHAALWLWILGAVSA